MSDQRFTTDVFRNRINERSIVLDVASHYPISPERWTLRVNGTRQLPQYGSVSQYNHAGDVHELKPSGGDTVVLETAERPRYVVQYEFAATWAAQTNQSLNSGDKVRVGLYDGTDGWFLEHNGDHADDRTCDLVTLRDGSEKIRKEGVDMDKAITKFARFKLRTGWYALTRQLWERSYSENGEQVNSTIGKTSTDDERGPKVGNLPLRYEVQAAAGTSGLVFEAGSCALVNLGATKALKRTTATLEEDTIGTTGSWVPLRAYRVDPDRDIMAVQTTNLSVGEYSASDDVELLFNSFDPSKVAASGGNQLGDADFVVPEDYTGDNSVVETSSAVAQVAGSGGVVASSVAAPGGFQVARGSLFDGAGNQVAGGDNPTGQLKRPVYSRDHVVILGKSDTTGDVAYQLRFEEDW